jgi:hypothetical protein
MAFRFTSDVAILPRVGFPFVPPARGTAAPAPGVCGAGLHAAPGGCHTWADREITMELLGCRGVVDEVR